MFGDIDKTVAEDPLARHDDQKRLLISAGKKREAFYRFRIRMGRYGHRRIIGEVADDFGYVFDQVFHVVRLAGKGFFDIVEIALGQVSLFHQFFDIKPIRLRRRNPAARGVELRQITEFFERCEFVAHRGGTDIRQMLFRDDFARHGDRGIDILIHHDLKYFLFPVGHFHLKPASFTDFGTSFSTMLALSYPKC